MINRKLVFIEYVHFEYSVNFLNLKFRKVREVLYYIDYELRKWDIFSWM